MKKKESASPYKGVRFPGESMSHCVWLSFRFSLRFRDSEEMMAQRGVVLTSETIRQWCLKFGHTYAHELKNRHGRPGDKWQGDEVFLKIDGKKYDRWRAVDQHGNVLEILVPSQSNKHAAKQCFRKLLNGLHSVPRVMLTEHLASSAAAKQEIMPSVEHRQHTGLNHRAEHSPQPTRQRERPMRRFKSPGHAQRCLSAFGPISDQFRPNRHPLSAAAYRALMQGRFQTWNEVTGVKTAA